MIPPMSQPLTQYPPPPPLISYPILIDIEIDVGIAAGLDVGFH